ncbi:MAG: serine/threonine-protein kinase [Myxococcota bacterium]
MICPRCHTRNLPGAARCAGCDTVTDGSERSPSQPPEARLGTTVGERYVLDAVLGSGSMGVVYGARRLEDGASLAIKMLHSHLAKDTTLLARFDREARATESLDHPSIVRFLDHGLDARGTPYLAMERLDGPNLLQLVRAAHPMAPARMARLLGQVLDALDVAHAAGVVHRDLKLENVVVVRAGEADERAKVCDFGIAQLAAPDYRRSGASGKRLTARGMVCGTPEYIAPEQARGHAVDGRADVYAVGVALYRMLTGVLPFRGESQVEVLTAHVTQPVVPPRTRAPELHVPWALERVCLRALAKRPEARFPNARAMRRALDRVIGALGPLAAEPLGTHAVDPTLPTPRRSAWPALAVAGAAAALAAAVLFAEALLGA